VTGVELILAALAAGAGAAAKTAAADAFAGLRDRLAGRVQAEPALWPARLGADLTESGADRDAEIIAAAHRLLGLVDPVGSAAGKYVVDVSDARGVQVGDGTVQVQNNYGTAAHTITGSVSVSYGQAPVPPAQPGA
jgi:hypothetical protein